MKKTVLLGLTGLALVGGYTGLWYYNAGHMKSELEATLAAHKENVMVSSSTINGFPGSANISLNGLDIFLKDIVNAHLDNADIKMGLTRKSYDIKNLSDITIKTDALKVDGKSPELVLKSSKDQKMQVIFKGNQLMNFLTGKLSIHPLQDKPLGLNSWKDLQSIEWTVSSSEIVDKATNAVLAKNGPSSLKLTIDPTSESNHKISFKVSGKDAEYTKEMDAYTDKIMAGLSTILEKSGMTPAPMVGFASFSSLGKASVDIDVTYSGVTDFSLIGKKPVNFDLEIAKYDQHSALSDSTTKGKISVVLGENASPKQITSKLEGTFKVTPAYTNMIKNQFIKLLEQDKEAQKGINGKVAEAMTKLIPDLSTWGEIKMNMDFFVDAEGMSFDIKDASYSCDKHGLAIQATGNMKNIIPEVHASLNIKNYETLISDLFAFVVAVQEEVKKSGEISMDIKLDENLKLNLIKFLKSIATKTEGESKDLNIKFDFSNGQLKVGDKDGNQILNELSALIAS